MNFQQRLQQFLNNQQNQVPAAVQGNAEKFSAEVQEYVPKQRWGNVFKDVIAYALGIGLGHAIAAALCRGMSSMAPSGIQTEQLAQSIDAGEFTGESFDAFLTNDFGVPSIAEVDLFGGAPVTLGGDPTGFEFASSADALEAFEPGGVLEILG